MGKQVRIDEGGRLSGVDDAERTNSLAWVAEKAGWNGPGTLRFTPDTAPEAGAVEVQTNVDRCLKILEEEAASHEAQWPQSTAPGIWRGFIAAARAERIEENVELARLRIEHVRGKNADYWEGFGDGRKKAEAELAGRGERQLRPELLSFALKMEVRLREKDAEVVSGNREHWSECSRDYLFGRMKEKLSWAERVHPIQSDPAGHIKALTDLANFTMMQADNTIRRLEPEPVEKVRPRRLVRRKGSRIRKNEVWHICECGCYLSYDNARPDTCPNCFAEVDWRNTRPLTAGEEGSDAE